jgi:hypothetical protein
MTHKNCAKTSGKLGLIFVFVVCAAISFAAVLRESEPTYTELKPNGTG